MHAVTRRRLHTLQGLAAEISEPRSSEDRDTPGEGGCAIRNTTAPAEVQSGLVE